jgi:hypothetical protein
MGDKRRIVLVKFTKIIRKKQVNVPWIVCVKRGFGVKNGFKDYKSGNGSSIYCIYTTSCKLT